MPCSAATCPYLLALGTTLLTKRLVGATDWVLGEQRARGPRIGYFGASTGAAAVPMAAPEREKAVGAMMSRAAGQT
ncbi:MAG: hypothetical protein M1474_03490 [Candidatus Marsarchaeota archaeon]|nr:hypothetical protein [Candidatus Marsarchaeota archaeon]